MSMRTRILLFLFLFALTPLMIAVVINLPLVLERVDLFYRQAFLQNLRVDFTDLDQHLATRNANVRLLARLPEPSLFEYDQNLVQARVDLERARYTDWINRILGDAPDIIEIRFLDNAGQDRFWLVRDAQTGAWYAPPEPLPPVSPQLRESVREQRFTDVSFSALRVDPQATDPQRKLTLHLVAPITRDDGSSGGAVSMTIDISGLAQRDRNTLWVLDSGEYLQLPQMPQRDSTAFEDFSGLQEDFKERRITLWEHDQRRVIWVPMFLTESGAPLWVGREVSSAPLQEFRSEMVQRVLAIVFVLNLLLLFVARLMAQRAERISSELLGGIQKTLDGDQSVVFDWRDNRELRQLSADLTQLSRRHAAQTRNLRAHTRELEQSNRYKSEFLANVSHELRTPLNSILLLSKLLAEQDAGLGDEQQEQARVIHKAGQDLRTLIDNILDLSKIEARQYQVHCIDVEVETLLEDVRYLLQPQFEARALPLTVSVQTATPRSIRSDADKVRQVLKNFLSNALKFTQRGQVRLIARPAEPPYAIELAVIDSGIGIPLDKQRKVFDAFQQADGSTNRRYGGTGLGLTISRQLAQLLQGEIRLRSAPGQGSTFSLFLPLSCGEDPQQLPAPDAGASDEIPEQEANESQDMNWSGVRVLVLEQDIKAQLLLTQLLTGWNAQVAIAGDLQEALETIEEEGPVSLLMITPALLGGQGCATIDAIKAQNKLPLTLVVIVEQPQNIASDCADLNPDLVLSKPLDPDRIRDSFRQWHPPGE